jgi:phytoene synthase
MSEPAEDLDALVRRADPDRWLSSRFIGDAASRADVIALYAFDHELARAPRVASNALMGEIRLTWWREVLDEVFAGREVRRHPTAQALAGAVRRHALPRDPLEAMIDARYRELDPAPMDEVELRDWARDTAGSVAVLAALLLGGEGGAARPAGAAWALSRRGAEPWLVKATLADARREVRGLKPAAFPAVAHAALIGPARGEVLSRLKLTWAVATGRI